MHIGEALMPREEAIGLAKEAVVASLERLGAYYGKKPAVAPDPNAVLPERIHADETWIFVPFRRVDPALDPFVIRINGVTRQVSVAPSLPGG